ncbi:PHD finger protein 21A-like [Atheta coriaria]|uniref:PHD finger protein 21A-like n=1 Tax=Dalotia coriaria TaxID=877792 RepID=UPI0031F44E9C
MINTEVPRELKCKILTNQMQMKEAISKHQKLMLRMKEVNIRLVKQVQDLINETEQQIVIIGLEQKALVDKLRKEHKAHQHKEKTNVIKNGVEDRRINLTNSFVRARKQNISSIIQSVSPSDESDLISTPTTPEPTTFNPINPQDISQTEFLTYFGLATHDVFKEIQNKRAERKRRRTANPQFLYSRGWDISKRKRNVYLASNVSPPNTRQSSKNKRSNSPQFKSSRPNSPVDKKNYGQRWPSDLTIERVKEEQVCAECTKPDNLLACEVCGCAFHVTCHNRPLSQTPRHCPKCLKSILAHEAEVSEKLLLRSQLEEKNKELTEELTKLQDQHSELEESLKIEDVAKKEMFAAQKTVETKIDTLIAFIKTFQEPKSIKPAVDSSPPPESPISEEKEEVFDDNQLIDNLQSSETMDSMVSPPASPTVESIGEDTAETA